MACVPLEPLRSTGPLALRPRGPRTRSDACRSGGFGPKKQALASLRTPRSSHIWLRLAVTDPPPTLLPIQDVVPPAFATHPRVKEIARLEGDAWEQETAGQLLESLDFWETAIESRRCFLSDAHEETGRAIECFILRCNSWSQLCMTSGHVPQSLELLKKAEAMFEATSSVQSFTQRHQLRAQMLQLVAAYYRARGKTQAALQSSNKAVRLSQRLRVLDRAILYVNHAVLLSAVGRHNEALAFQEQAVSILVEDQEGGQTSLEEETPPETGEAAFDLRKEEADAYLLVVARHNMWIEHCHLGTHAEGGWCIQRAAQIAMMSLGDAHPLTLKMDAAADWHLRGPLPPPKVEPEAEEGAAHADGAATASIHDESARKARPSSARQCSPIGRDGGGFEESEKAMQQLAERNVIRRRFVPHPFLHNRSVHAPPTAPKAASPRSKSLRSLPNSAGAGADGASATDEGWVPSRMQERVYGLRQRNLPSWALTPRQALDAESLLRPWNTPRRRKLSDGLRPKAVLDDAKDDAGDAKGTCQTDEAEEGSAI